MISAQTKKASAAFAGAVVLASGAYAIGNENGDGSATAKQAGNGSRAAGPPGPNGMPGNAQMRREFRQHRRQMLGSLAKELGVKEADLRKALTEIRKERRDDFAAKLAKKLGISEAKVKAELPDRPKAGAGRRGGHGGGFGGPPPAGPPPAGSPPAAPQGP